MLHRCKKCSDIFKAASVGRVEISSMEHWAKGLFVRFWIEGLLAELQARMSRDCRFLLFWHHNYQVSFLNWFLQLLFEDFRMIFVPLRRSLKFTPLFFVTGFILASVRSKLNNCKYKHNPKTSCQDNHVQYSMNTDENLPECYVNLDQLGEWVFFLLIVFFFWPFILTR